MKTDNYRIERVFFHFFAVCFNQSYIVLLRQQIVSYEEKVISFRAISLSTENCWKPIANVCIQRTIITGYIVYLYI